MPVVDLTTRFADLVSRDDFRVEDAAFLIGAHAYPEYDPADGGAALDAWAERVPAADLPSLLATLFGRGGFAGDAIDYYDPRNSFLPDVLVRRRGIPISLSVLLIAVARRVGIAIEPIGTPAHVLTRLVRDPDCYIDAFDGGRVLRRADLAPMFARLAPGVDLDPYLQPMPSADVVRRMLGNLVGIWSQSGDHQSLVWATRLRSLVPGAGSDDVRAHARAVAVVGDFGQAASILERIGQPEVDTPAIRSLRARLN